MIPVQLANLRPPHRQGRAGMSIEQARMAAVLREPRRISRRLWVNVDGSTVPYNPQHHYHLQTFYKSISEPEFPLGQLARNEHGRGQHSRSPPSSHPKSKNLLQSYSSPKSSFRDMKRLTSSPTDAALAAKMNPRAQILLHQLNKNLTAAAWKTPPKILLKRNSIAAEKPSTTPIANESKTLLAVSATGGQQQSSSATLARLDARLAFLAANREAVLLSTNTFDLVQDFDAATLEWLLEREPKVPLAAKWFPWEFQAFAMDASAARFVDEDQGAQDDSFFSFFSGGDAGAVLPAGVLDGIVEDFTDGASSVIVVDEGAASHSRGNARWISGGGKASYSSLDPTVAPFHPFEYGPLCFGLSEH